ESRKGVELAAESRRSHEKLDAFFVIHIKHAIGFVADLDVHRSDLANEMSHSAGHEASEGRGVLVMLRNRDRNDAAVLIRRALADQCFLGGRGSRVATGDVVVERESR